MVLPYHELRNFVYEGIDWMDRWMGEDDGQVRRKKRRESMEVWRNSQSVLGAVLPETHCWRQKKNIFLQNSFYTCITV